MPGRRLMSGHYSAQPTLDLNRPQYCTVVQIRYTCGHAIGGEFIKCGRHFNKEDERCSSRWIVYVEGKNSPHKCRQCLRSA